MFAGARHLFAAHAEGVLGLVNHGLVVLVGVNSARGLVSHALTGRFLIVRNDVTVKECQQVCAMKARQRTTMTYR